MVQSKVLYQQGFSLDELYQTFGAEQQCEEELECTRWPESFKCPQCGSKSYDVILDQCRKDTNARADCTKQVSLLAPSLNPQN